MHCVTQAPHPLLCPDLDKWPPRDDDGPPRIGLSEDGTGVRRSSYYVHVSFERGAEVFIIIFISVQLVEDKFGCRI